MSLYREIAAKLRQRLAAGEFPVGQDFLSYADVAKEFECSDGTATRAMRLLHNEGLIQIQQGYRNKVIAQPTDEVNVLAELRSIRTTVNRLIEHLERAAAY